MMRRQRKQHLVDEDDVLEIVDNSLSVKEVHGRGQPIPVQALGRSQLPCLAGDACNGDNLAEGNNLNGGDDDDDVDVAHEQRGEEASHHDKGPKGSRHEVGLLLVILLLFFGKSRLGGGSL